MRHKDDEKEQRIKEAVIAVVLEEGFGGASISKIAKRADISSATVYIYHENKESMLQAIYMQFAEEMYEAILSGVQDAGSGAQKIERIIRSYFDYIVSHGNEYAFIEQFSSSPALTHKCDEIKGFARVMSLLSEWQRAGILRPYNLVNIYALLFHPVKMLAAGSLAYHTDAGAQLDELVKITQKALLAEQQ